MADDKKRAKTRRHSKKSLRAGVRLKTGKDHKIVVASSNWEKLLAVMRHHKIALPMVRILQSVDVTVRALNSAESDAFPKSTALFVPPGWKKGFYPNWRIKGAWIGIRKEKNAHVLLGQKVMDKLGKPAKWGLEELATAAHELWHTYIWDAAVDDSAAVVKFFERTSTWLKKQKLKNGSEVQLASKALDDEELRAFTDEYVGDLVGSLVKAYLQVLKRNKKGSASATKRWNEELQKIYHSRVEAYPGAGGTNYTVQASNEEFVLHFLIKTLGLQPGPAGQPPPARGHDSTTFAHGNLTDAGKLPEPVPPYAVRFWSGAPPRYRFDYAWTLSVGFKAYLISASQGSKIDDPTRLEAVRWKFMQSTAGLLDETLSDTKIKARVGALATEAEQKPRDYPQELWRDHRWSGPQPAKGVAPIPFPQLLAPRISLVTWLQEDVRQVLDKVRVVKRGTQVHYRVVHHDLTEAHRKSLKIEVVQGTKRLALKPRHGRTESCGSFGIPEDLKAEERTQFKLVASFAHGALPRIEVKAVHDVVVPVLGPFGLKAWVEPAVSAKDLALAAAQGKVPWSEAETADTWPRLRVRASGLKGVASKLVHWEASKRTSGDAFGLEVEVLKNELQLGLLKGAEVEGGEEVLVRARCFGRSEELCLRLERKDRGIALFVVDGGKRTPAGEQIALPASQSQLTLEAHRVASGNRSLKRLRGRWSYDNAQLKSYIDPVEGDLPNLLYKPRKRPAAGMVRFGSGTEKASVHLSALSWDHLAILEEKTALGAEHVVTIERGEALKLNLSAQATVKGSKPIRPIEVSWWVDGKAVGRQTTLNRSLLLGAPAVTVQVETNGIKSPPTRLSAQPGKQKLVLAYMLKGNPQPISSKVTLWPGDQRTLRVSLKDARGDLHRCKSYATAAKWSLQGAGGSLDATVGEQVVFTCAEKALIKVVASLGAQTASVEIDAR